MRESPDYIYTTEGQEILNFEERHELVTNIPYGAIGEFSTLIQGPKKYAAIINGKGCWFDDKDEALAAVGRSMGALN